MLLKVGEHDAKNPKTKTKTKTKQNKTKQTTTTTTTKHEIVGPNGTPLYVLSVNINGWQLAKMKKSIPDMSLP